MKPKVRFIPLIVLTLYLAACTQDAYQGMVVFSGMHTVDAGESIQGELLVLSGQVVLIEGSSVTGSVYMTGGTVILDAVVAKDINLIGGELSLGPEAVVGGSINVGGGSLQRDPKATVRGEVVRGLGVDLPAEFVLPEPTLSERLPSFVMQTALVLLFALFTSSLAPHALTRVVAAVTSHPIVSGAVGFLVGVVAIALFVLMAFTIVLIPVTLLGVFALGAAIVYGWLAFGLSLGELLFKRLGWGMRLMAIFGTLIFMLLLFALEFLPMMGVLLLIMLSSMGLGAVFVTGLGSRTFVPAVYEESPD